VGKIDDDDDDDKSITDWNEINRGWRRPGTPPNPCRGATGRNTQHKTCLFTLSAASLRNL